MNIELLLLAIVAVPFIIIIISWIDVKLYKNHGTRWLIEEKKELNGDREIWREMIKVNIKEWSLFISGLIIGVLIGFV